MRYKNKNTDTMIRKDGQLRRPAYDGLMVLMDYLSPRFANEYRRFKNDFAKAYGIVNDSPAGRRLKEQREAIWDKPFSEVDFKNQAQLWKETFGPMRRRFRARFARLCTKAFEAGKKLR